MEALLDMEASLRDGSASRVPENPLSPLRLTERASSRVGNAPLAADLSVLPARAGIYERGEVNLASALDPCLAVDDSLRLRNNAATSEGLASELAQSEGAA